MTRTLIAAAALAVVLTGGCSRSSETPYTAGSQQARERANVSPLDPVEEVLGEQAAPKAETAPAADAQLTSRSTMQETAVAIEETTMEETPNPRVTASGLKIEDLVVGEGPSVEVGNTVSVHYTGWLEDGKKFDSSLDRGQPFNVPVGQGRVIEGWEEGLVGMRKGGKRRLTIPPHLAYGERGAPGAIPPNATIIFEIECLSIR